MKSPRLQLTLLLSVVILSALLVRQLNHPVTLDDVLAAKPAAVTSVRRLEHADNSARAFVRSRGAAQAPAARAVTAATTASISLAMTEEIGPGARDGMSTYSGLLEAWEAKLRDNSASASLIISQLGQEDDPEIVSILERA